VPMAWANESCPVFVLFLFSGGRDQLAGRG
jgi:hypothetical protein